MKRALVTLVLALGLLLGPAGPAQASFGHHCHHSDAHTWTYNGKSWRTQFYRHYTTAGGTAPRHYHENHWWVDGAYGGVDTVRCYFG